MADLEITIDDMPEEAVYALIYGEELWPDIVVETLDADIIDG